MHPGGWRYGRKLRTIGLLGVLTLLLTGLAPAEDEPPGRDVIELDQVRAEIRTGETLAFVIEAGRGFYAADSRIVTLMGPQVRIYDKQGNLQDRVRGEEGRMWPVPAMVVQEDGTTAVVTKYNWSLKGDVVFETEQGYLLKTPELFFDHESSEIRSESGISYVMPTGKGGVLEGTAREFRSVMAGETSRLQNWILSGQIQLTLKNAK